ncbi:transcription elongation factor Spt5 [Candidatus Woesearchaeota archaeon CG11_big_fil_rev_8_21_14_0_20_43_8]|nr:MAG: transcription elongation factor Spt5 [Candidatus Woesearchaeota archaeon CG11_big_fil_rev_8_21_14_0_20_43_8]PIO04970.1 MAG: transcription elongation factor Spt5 [Candidatus Woesearchaeota archaeon CG08_land_8_20_14_0_20_43_7]
MSENKEEKRNVGQELSEEDKELLEGMNSGEDSGMPLSSSPIQIKVRDRKQPPTLEKIEVKEEEENEEEKVSKVKDKPFKTKIFVLRTTANREDQVLDFVSSNAAKKKLGVYSLIRAHGMRGYIFVEADTRSDAEQAAFNIPYARGILPNEVQYKEIEHMLEQVKREINIKKNDIVEIISGPFKREKAKISRIDKTKEEVVVELLESAVPIPITLKLDTVKVIRRDNDDDMEE